MSATEGQPGGLLGAMGDEVSPVELLFDLAFVFAISQLSGHLQEDLSWRGALETGVLLLAVFGIWSLASFAAVMPGISRRSAVGALLTLLTLGLFFNAGLPSAFSSQPWLFVAPFVACNVAIAVFFAVFVDVPTMRAHGRSMVIWVVPSAALWLIGALATPQDRVWWFLAGAMVDLVGAWTAHPLPWRRFRSADVRVPPSHMIERSRLFLIIALGETILATGTALSSASIDGWSVASGVLAVLGTISLWALYFAGSDRRVSEHAVATGDPLRAARLAINGQVVVAAALILLAVGYERAIAHPQGTSGAPLAVLLFGGGALYVAFQTWYLRALTGRTSRVRVLGGIALAAAAVPAAWLPAWAALLTSSAILGALALRTARDASPHR